MSETITRVQIALSRKLHTSSRQRGKGRQLLVFTLSKRQKFVIAVLFLSFCMFFTRFQIGKPGFFFAVLLASVTELFLYWSIHQDLEENQSMGVFILPFFYTLAFSFFYFLVPARLLFQILLTVGYGFGLYSLFLSQNVFIVGSIRTIALLSGARIVSFIITLLSYFFLTTAVLSLHLFVIQTTAIIALYTYPLIFQSLWTYTLQKANLQMYLWAGGLTLCLLESYSILWFWPSLPTVMALFLTGFLYTIVGLSHVWHEKRLFRGVLWEYVWVGAAVFFILILFTSWGK